MKNLSLLVALILFSCCVTSLATSRELNEFSSFNDEKLGWWHYHYNPYCPPCPNTKPKALPPIPAGWKPFQPSPVGKQCMADCKDARKCYLEVGKAFATKNPIFSKDCCDSIVKLTKDCETTVFGHYHNQYFNCFIKLHCATKGGSTPSAPAPA